MVTTGHAPNNALLKTEGLSAGYGSALAIRDINLEVRPGEVVALLGRNGAGKTTTLLTLAGEIRPKSGHVMWNGSTKHSPLHKRARQGLGFVPEDRAVFGRLTTEQNLRLLRDPNVGEVLRLFPALSRMLNRRAGLLSGGEQRMLAVGRALSGGATLLMADELTLGLAPRTSEELFAGIRAAADQGLGALIVEQHVHRILKYADRAYVMDKGRIQFSGSADEARARLDEIQSHYMAGGAKSERGAAPRGQVSDSADQAEADGADLSSSDQVGSAPNAAYATQPSEGERAVSAGATATSTVSSNGSSAAPTR